LDFDFKIGLDFDFKIGLDFDFKIGLDFDFKFGLDFDFKTGLDFDFKLVSSNQNSIERSGTSLLNNRLNYSCLYKSIVC